MSRVDREVRVLRFRLEAHTPPDPWAASASLLEHLVLEYLPCKVCVEAYLGTILAWRENGISNPPGRDPISLGTSWDWSGGAHAACRSHCLLNRYLRAPHRRCSAGGGGASRSSSSAVTARRRSSKPGTRTLPGNASRFEATDELQVPFRNAPHRSLSDTRALPSQVEALAHD